MEDEPEVIECRQPVSAFESEEISDAVESEQIFEGFVCCVCLDLLYKPIVLACGHVACFWCVHKAMSIFHESQCPICRNPYHHFPVICRVLHFLLLKMYPATYKIREKRTQEEEEKMGLFSPKIDDLASSSHSNENSNHLGDQGQSLPFSSQANLHADQCPSKQEGCESVGQLEFVPSCKNLGRTNPSQRHTSGFEATSSVAVEENTLSPNGTNGRISIVDVLCSLCQKLLFRPVVLNCGHVYCQTCIISPADEALTCQVCQTPHPSGFPKPCLEFHRFLEEQFPTEYASRGESFKLNLQDKLPIKCSREDDKQVIFPAKDKLLPRGHHHTKIHIGAGCDSCGMYPIIGDRYRCKDCKEKIGFDVCGNCYGTSSKLPGGRFNQQHTPDHQFEIVQSDYDMSRTEFEGGIAQLLAIHSAGSHAIVIGPDELGRVMHGDTAEDESDDSEPGQNSETFDAVL